ncbi:hypothetical protein OXA73_23540 [Klebsiella pneumoniae]|uniref:hypothetical protein n=1 Tax=Klebsiella pneumoniae TaxID=573 RepID=UPI0022734F40|nr:hypothetical protein [Klebsiella pneumoniae]WDU74458.1 hypothetical protein PWK27_26105 [Klebsiella pneumoniae]
MKKQPDVTLPTPDSSALSSAELLSVIAGLQQQLASKEAVFERALKEREQRI